MACGLILLSALLVMAECYVSPSHHAPRRRRPMFRAGMEAAEGDVVLYRRETLEIGLVTATADGSQWIQPLVAHSEPEADVTLFQDEGDQVRIQGGCEAIVSTPALPSSLRKIDVVTAGRRVADAAPGAVVGRWRRLRLPGDRLLRRPQPRPPGRPRPPSRRKGHRALDALTHEQRRQ
mmetsp:Transcript_2984/g.9021  ORF Transcript_2984/g.9021 Transcript_2984/m.9021 type:complete len:178 (-) Transcript_2984:640-1173(-)